MIGGWALAYIVKAGTGAFTGMNGDTAGSVFNSIIADPGTLLIWHTAFMAITAWVVAMGVTGGLERASKLMMPALFILLLILIGYAMTAGRSVKIEGFSQGSALTVGDVNRYYGTFKAHTQSTGSFTGSIVESKPERISFIPPKSRLFINTRWNLMSGSFASGWTKSLVPASYMPKRMEEIKVREYAREDSPLTFRNFLTWSFTEDFGQEFHVDNSFWVRRVTSMTNKQFKGLRLSNEGPPASPYAYPYGGGDRFYFEFKD